MGSNKYEVNMTGSTVGAVAVGPGASAKGDVSIGGDKKPATESFQMKLEIRKASRADVVQYLREVLKHVEAGRDTGAIGTAGASLGQTAFARGCAWTIVQDWS